MGITLGSVNTIVCTGSENSTGEYWWKIVY